MGIDLILLPFYDRGMKEPTKFAFSHTVLDLTRRRELWPEIEKLEKQYGMEVPNTFYSYLSRENEDTHYGLTNHTPYGDTLKWIPAKVLKPLKDYPAITDNYKNRATWAYLELLPDDLPIALYWH